MSAEAKFEIEASLLPLSQSPPANNITDKWLEKSSVESTTGSKMSDVRSPNTPVRSPSSYQQRATHSRSSSWSYTSGNGQVTLTHLNPIRSVIREFVPSFRSSRATGSQRSSSSSPLSPLSPSTYVDLSEAFRSDLESGMHRDTARLRNESSGFSNGNSNSAQSSEAEEVNMTSGNIPGNSNPRTGGDRMEFQGTINWLEKSLPFVLLLLSRIMWDHRLGECFTGAVCTEIILLFHQFMFDHWLANDNPKCQTYTTTNIFLFYTYMYFKITITMKKWN